MDCAGFHLNNINSKTIESWEQCKKEDRRQKRKVKKIFFYIYIILWNKFIKHINFVYILTKNKKNYY